MSIPDVVTRFLRARGFLSLEDQVDFLNPKLADLRDPFVLKGMEPAVDRLLSALENQETLGLYCDYDLDGTSALALLYDGLTQIGFKQIERYQPRRLKEGYGFHKEGVDFFAEKKVSLIITADVGITARETALYAKEKGVDLILTDHHLPDETLPEALALINPNTKECHSGLGHLCGAGVAFYLVYALVKKLKAKNIPVVLKLDSLLDYFVIGTITDMVPLIKENRVLVKKGLEHLTLTKRPSFRALKLKNDLIGKRINSMDIGFKIAPKLNSLSRLDTDLKPIDILIEKEEEKALALVDQALEINSQRVDTLEEGLKEALCFFEDHEPQAFCLYVSKNIHPGVMGLIASRVSDLYGLPSLVGSQLENGQVVGSGRLPRESHLSLKDIFNDCYSLQQFGGHAQAAGFELRQEKLDSFRKELGLYFASLDLKEDSFYQDLSYDCEVKMSELGKDFIPWLYQLEPFGMDFPQPTFKLANIKIKEVKKLKELHYKLRLTDAEGYQQDLLWFSPSQTHPLVAILEEEEGLEEFQFNFFVQPQINYFRRQESLQLLFVDGELSY